MNFISLNTLQAHIQMDAEHFNKLFCEQKYT